MSVATVYGAGQPLVAIFNDVDLRVYYNDVLIGAISTITNTTGTKNGVWADTVGNSIDNFIVYPYGSNGEFDALEAF